MPESALNSSALDLDTLAGFDTCILADALEILDLRLRNRGYTRPGLRAVTGYSFPPVAGYAVTARVRSSDPPILGNSFVYNNDWWPAIPRTPAPRIAVIEDVDPHPGVGACVGFPVAALFQRLGCRALVTNGAVRDLPTLAEMRFPVLASHVSPSHSYAHLVDHSAPVAICGLIIEAGDLLVADTHGVVSIPPEIVPQLPAIAADLARRKKSFVDFCRSTDFSLDKLMNEVKQLKP